MATLKPVTCCAAAPAGREVNVTVPTVVPALARRCMFDCSAGPATEFRHPVDLALAMAAYSACAAAADG